MEDLRILRQIDFLMEVDKLKQILRRTLLMDGSRRENDAEHSWHMALMATVLQEYALEKSLDMERVLKMILVHDIVEVYAGDTFAYDTAALGDKQERERQAADRIFGMLPGSQGECLRAMWEEFDAMQTPESLFAAAMDRFQPLLHNYKTKGHTWREGNVTKAQVYARMEPIKLGAPALWGMVEHIVAWGVQEGYISA